MTEAQRAARARLNIYYKARVCKNQIKASYYRQGKLAKNYANARVRNLRTGESNVTVKQLDAALKDSEIQKLWSNYQNFMYKGSNNVAKCLGDLMADPDENTVRAKVDKANDGKTRPQGSGRGLYLKRFTEHKSCQTIEKDFAAQLASVIDDHCMPELAN